MKKNIWTFYFLVVALSVVAFVFFAKHLYESEKLKVESEQADTLQLLNQSLHGALVENELLLDMLGKQLLENALYKDKQQTHQLLNKMLTFKSELLGFGLVDLDGNYIAVSGNLKTEKLPNLKEVNSRGFQHALQSDRLVFGKTWYFSPADAWGISLREALRDAQGNVVALMTTGVNPKKIGVFETMPVEPKNFMILNPANGHFIYVNKLLSEEYPRYYSEPINSAGQEKIDQAMLKRYQVTMKQAQALFPDRVLTMGIDAAGRFSGGYTSAIYNSTYGVWLGLVTSTKQIYSSYLQTLAIYLVVFLLTHLLIYFLVRRIAFAEQSRQDELSFNAEHDDLTGLHNRHYLKKRFKELKVATKSRRISLLFLDLDNFKHINDSFGHSIGDKLLAQVAKRLQGMVNGEHTIIRFGGDEFVILLVDCQQTDQDVAKQLIESVSVTYLIDGLDFSIGASVGIARGDTHTASIDKLLSQADLAMYAAKKRKNWIEVFSNDFQVAADKRSEVEHHLREALNNRELYMVYQPQMDQNQRIYGVEALLRWHSEALGQVSPVDFIPLAEEIGIMPEVGKFVMQTAISEMSELQQKLQRPFQLSINVSVKQFTNRGYFYDDLIGVLDKTGFPAEQLTVEVTESLFIEELEPILNTLYRIRRKGISISLDDFGTGFSSLSHLRQLPIDELKIDKSFIDDVLTDSKDAALISSMLDIAKKLGMHTVAEGVEQENQAVHLAAYGCDFYQGYLYAKPLKLDELEQFIQTLDESSETV